jgi:ribosomal subunit interface protein
MVDCASNLLKKLYTMNIIIKSVDFKTSVTLENFIREKVSKLHNYCDSIIRANVVLRKQEKGNTENKSCEIKLMVPGYDHIVKKTTDVYEKSIAQAVEVLQKIIRRNKAWRIAKRNSNSLYTERIQ